MPLNVLHLPQPVSKQLERATQTDVPETKGQRDAILGYIQDHLASTDLVPPLSMVDLQEQAQIISARHGIEDRFLEFTALIVNNELWRDEVATIPFERRLLLLPKCLRVEDKCPAPFDEFGLLCKKCGLCSIEDLQDEAERLGYAVLVAEGSPIVMAIIETGKIDAIVGVSCLNVLRKVYSYMEAAAVPGIAIPLLQDDCIDTNVDLDWVWDSVHLTSDDKTRRLDLTTLREKVDACFTDDALAALMGAPESETERLGQAWLARAGKRWRPFLTAAIYQSLQEEPSPRLTPDLERIAVAVECFHKASLIHDDIEDGDDERYGEPTLHAELGIPVAINVGDFLLGEGYRLLTECEASPQVVRDMLKVAAEGHRSLCLGQGTELSWQQNPKPLTPIQVVDIFRQKTAPAFEIALRLGAIYGGAEPDLHETLQAYSRAVGIAYQIRDDLEDLGEHVAAGAMPEGRPTILWALAHKLAKKDVKPIIAEAWCGGADANTLAAGTLAANSMASAEQTGPQDIDAIYRLFAKLEVESEGADLLAAYKEEAIRSLRLLDNVNVKGLLRRTIGKIFEDLEIKGWCNEFETRNATGVETRTAVAG